MWSQVDWGGAWGEGGCRRKRWGPWGRPRSCVASGRSPEAVSPCGPCCLLAQETRGRMLSLTFLTVLLCTLSAIKCGDVWTPRVTCLNLWKDLFLGPTWQEAWVRVQFCSGLLKFPGCGPSTAKAGGRKNWRHWWETKSSHLSSRCSSLRWQPLAIN